jgi:hypothetical protein
MPFVIILHTIENPWSFHLLYFLTRSIENPGKRWNNLREYIVEKRVHVFGLYKMNEEERWKNRIVLWLRNPRDLDC